MGDGRVTVVATRLKLAQLAEAPALLQGKRRNQTTTQDHPWPHRLLAPRRLPPPALLYTSRTCQSGKIAVPSTPSFAPARSGLHAMAVFDQLAVRELNPALPALSEDRRPRRNHLGRSIQASGRDNWHVATKYAESWLSAIELTSNQPPLTSGPPVDIPSSHPLNCSRPLCNRLVLTPSPHKLFRYS